MVFNIVVYIVNWSLKASKKMFWNYVLKHKDPKWFILI